MTDPLNVPKSEPFRPTDGQRLVLNMCLEAEKAGHSQAWISRIDLLEGRCSPAGTPIGVHLKMMWAALTLPDGVLEWSADGQQFRMSEATIAHILAKVAARSEGSPH